MHAKSKFILKILFIAFVVVIAIVAITLTTFYFINKKYSITNMLGEKVSVYNENYNRSTKKFNETPYNSTDPKDSNPFFIISNYAVNPDLTESMRTERSFLTNLQKYASVNEYNIVVFNNLLPYFYNSKFNGAEQKPIKLVIEKLNGFKDILNANVSTLSKNLLNSDAFDYVNSKLIPAYNNYITTFNELNNTLVLALTKDNGIKDSYLLNNLKSLNITFEIVKDFYLPNLLINRDVNQIPNESKLELDYTTLLSLIDNLDTYLKMPTTFVPTIAQTKIYLTKVDDLTKEYDKFKTCVSKLTKTEKIDFFLSDKSLVSIVTDTTLKEYNDAFVRNFLSDDVNGTFSKYLADPAVTAYLVK